MRFPSPFRHRLRLETAKQTHADLPGDADRETGANETESAPVLSARVSHVLRARLCRVWLGSGAATFCGLTALQCALTDQTDGFYGAAFFACCTAFLVIWVRQAIRSIYDRDNAMYLRLRETDRDLIDAEMENAIVRRENAALLTTFLTMSRMQEIAQSIAEDCVDVEAKIVAVDWKH